MGRIYLLRHGETLANRERVLQGPRIDTGLSDVGQRQAESLAGALRDVPLDAVFTSPLHRARETAHFVVRAHPRDPLPVQVVPELYEMDYGQFAGRVYDEVAGEMEQVFDAWRLGYVDQSFPGGESAILAQHRIRPFATRVMAAARGSDVAVVAHGRINRVLLATWTGAGLTQLEQFPQSNASITELEVAESGAHVTRLNDTAHLDHASETFS